MGNSAFTKSAISTPSTAGVSAGPASSITQTITHTLGRAPVRIRLDGISTFLANSSAIPPGISMGVWNPAGNFGVQIGNSGTGASSPASSTSAAIVLYGTAGSATGVIGNVTSTTFDIVWTVTATCTNTAFMWEVQ